MDETNILVCECGSTEHQLVFHHDDVEQTVYVHVMLNKLPFLRRLKHAARYLLGYQCKYGSFEEVILGPKHIDGILKVVQTLEGKNK